MRYVVGFFPPDRIFALVDALSEIHVHGMSVSEAQGFGQEHDASHPEHQEHLGIEMTKKTRIEIICRDEEVDRILDAIYKAAHSGRRGDGKVFVLPVLDALRLKTGERGEAALGDGVTGHGADLVAGGRRLYAQRLPSPSGRTAPTIVFLHEALGSIGQWKGFPAALCSATGLPGFVHERWGFGKSEPKGPGPWPVDYLEREASALDEVLTAAGIDRPVLFGHSDGGTIALLYAAAFPDKAEAVISEAAHVLVEEMTLEGIRVVVESSKDGRLLRALHRFHGEKTADVFSGWADTWLAPGFRDWNIVGKLSTIRRPLLVLQGTEDHFGTEVQVDSICRSVSGPVESRYFQGAGHVPHLEAGEAVIRETHRFLAGCGVPVTPLQSPKPGN